MMGDMQEAVRWGISVPIFKNTVILIQLGLAICIPFGLVALVIALVSERSRDMLYAIGLIAALLILTLLFVMAVYSGKYEAEFVLDGKGVLCRTGAKQARKNRVINTMTVILGLLTGKPAAAGAGILADSRQETFLRWNRITRVKYKSKSHTILLHGGWTENIALFCAEENYETVKAFVRRNIPLPAKGDNR
jgi:hypothetical protein